MFQFPRFAPSIDGNMSSTCWVAPFGNLRIKGRLHLPEAYRSLPRPSSPPRAKASTVTTSFFASQSQGIHRSLFSSFSNVKLSVVSLAANPLLIFLHCELFFLLVDDLDNLVCRQTSVINHRFYIANTSKIVVLLSSLGCPL